MYLPKSNLAAQLFILGTSSEHIYEDELLTYVCKADQ